jgi:hypothetical protein
MSEHTRSSIPWLVLGGILVVYAMAVLRLHPAAFFGLSEDDAIYFSSAKAMAEGQGYVMPNIPGAPAATKYPLLYPWLLSWVWKWNPSFPSNLNNAVAMNIAFGVAFIVGAFFFLKEVGRLGNAESLFLSAFCGLHPLILLHTANILTEIPFAAFTLWALLMAHRATRQDATRISTILCGVLAGCSILVRILGAPVAAGIYLSLLYRKGWRRSLVFAGCVAPFFAVPVWRLLTKTAASAPPFISQCARVWQMSWTYYTSYFSFWRADAIQTHAIWNLIKENLILLSIQPGVYFLDPTVLKPAGPAIIAGVLLSVGVWKGLIFHAQRRLEPIHFVLAIYLIPVILWDYPLVERFLIPFLPYIALGLWLEIRKVLALVKRSLAGSAPRSEKPAAVFLCLVTLALAVFIGWSFRLGITSALEKSRLRGKMLDEKRSAYTWLKNNTAAEDKVIAYEDASLFLYTGRQSLRPVIFMPAGNFQPELQRMELECITASAQALAAKYWLISADDFGMEPGEVARLGRAREKEFESVLPAVFSGAEGQVRIVRIEGYK